MQPSLPVARTSAISSVPPVASPAILSAPMSCGVEKRKKIAPTSSLVAKLNSAVAALALTSNAVTYLLVASLASELSANTPLVSQQVGQLVTRMQPAGFGGNTGGAPPAPATPIEPPLLLEPPVWI